MCDFDLQRLFLPTVMHKHLFTHYLVYMLSEFEMTSSQTECDMCLGPEIAHRGLH